MKKYGFFNQLFRNREYILYYARILMNIRVAGSYLGFLWLYIDPLMFMLIYTFVVQVVFHSNMENFHVFVLMGLTSWNFFSRTVLMGTTSIARNKGVFEQVYFHKFVYPTIYMLSYLYEYMISMFLVLVMMAVSGIPFTIHILEVVFVMIPLVLFTYGCALIAAHIGVYLFDFRNILDFLLRFFFYFTPIMWSMERLENYSWAWILKLNPLSVLIGSLRSCLFYGKSPVYFYLLVISVASCFLIWLGFCLIGKFEGEYARRL